MFESSALGVVPSGAEPPLPWGRDERGGWVFAPVGAMLIVASGHRVVCHACGTELSAVSGGHARRHGLDLAGYRERFGLNRTASLVAPVLASVRREEGRRRWAGNEGVRAGLAVGQEMARAGVLHELGSAAQPAGARRPQGRAAASKEAASAALRGHREAQGVAARERWTVRVRELGFDTVEEYLTARVAQGATVHRVRRELGCGGTVAQRLLEERAAEGAGSAPST